MFSRGLCLRTISSLLFLLILSACSGIKIINGLRTDLYDQEFITKISQIREQHKGGKSTVAIRQLNLMKDEDLSFDERAVKYNFLGTIYFSKTMFEKSIAFFIKASGSVKHDKSLMGSIYLNLASAHYKLSAYQKAFEYVKQVDASAMSEKEKEKVFRLGHVLATQLGEKRDAFVYLVYFLGLKKSITEIKQNSLSDKMLAYFFALSTTERIRMLEGFEDEKQLSLAFLAYRDAEARYFAGNSEIAKDILDWLQNYYGNNPEVSKLVDEFLGRLENIAKIDSNTIGIVMPFSGEKKSFARRAMLGIDHALQELQKKFPEEFGNTKLVVRDSQGSGIVGAHQVGHLINENNVSIVIGGLFSSEAEAEYLEAKKNGTFFISLSPIFLPREEKNHLLLEVPGSVESQVNSLLTPEVVEALGSRMGIVYSQTPRGLAYMNELWRQAEVVNVQITNIQSYAKEDKDFRYPVKKLLGLEYKRERQEELDLWTQIHSLQEKKSIRRIQTLSPVVDFDWVFLTAYPQKALQIIPSFRYFDSPRLTYVGGPSWKSRRLLQQSRKLGRIYFFGDRSSCGDGFKYQFYGKYKRYPKLVEMLAYDAVGVMGKLLAARKFEKRLDFERYIMSASAVAGCTGNWHLKEDLWIKDMSIYKMYRGKIVDVLTNKNSTVEGSAKPVALEKVKKSEKI